VEQLRLRRGVETLQQLLDLLFSQVLLKELANGF